MNSIPITRRGLAVLLAASALALPAAAAASPDLEVHGNFKRMAHTGDTSGKVRLGAIDARAGLYGVGALAGLRGEIMIWDGRVLVTRGESEHGTADAPRAADEAVLLVTGRVSGWNEVRVPADMDARTFETFVLESAHKHGVLTAEPFAFAVRGAFPRVRWHVVTGARPKTPGASGHGHGHAGSRVFDEPQARGQVLGFYSAARLEGVISHPGERFHLHYADADFRRGGHVDDYVVGRDAVLLLPQQ